MINFDALHDLALFVQFKKREKRPWGSITFRVTLIHGGFHVF